MITIEEAQQKILHAIKPLPVEDVPLLAALGRVLAEDVSAPWDIPGADNSAMDGYAFSFASLTENRLRASGFLPAGDTRTAPVMPGEAVRIMTGAPIPPGCDTVVPIEDVQDEGEMIRVTGPVKGGDHIRKRGEDVRAGEVVVAAGTVLRPQEIGMLVSLGQTSVEVYRKPAVSILATGDELLEPGSTPVPGKLINSNSHSLAAQTLDAGCLPLMQGVAQDSLEATRDLMKKGLEADVLITTGGVSVGDKDYVKDAIVAIGGELLFWKVNMKPGKPVAFALVDGKPVFALPGNPVAAMVAFEMFVRPALLKMMGHALLFRPMVKATLLEKVKNKGPRPHLVRCKVKLENGKYNVASTGSQSSASLSSLTSGNGLMRLPPEQSLTAGEEVEVALLDRHFEMRGFLGAGAP